LSDQSDADITLPFPIAFVIRDTPRSHQSKNNKAKELWKQKVGEIASTYVKTLRDFLFIDDRPLAATMFRRADTAHATVIDAGYFEPTRF
jgi:hypothetical protein